MSFSQNKLNIFVTGGTGYIGGAVISRLIQHPDAKSFEISALVRTAEKAKKLETLGVRPVIGSYSDLKVLTEEAAKADYVIALADADALPAAEAILAGLKQRHEKTGTVPKLIHTSGTAFIMDNAKGMHGDHTIYSDLDADAIAALPETAPHRHVDIPIIGANLEGYVRSYIVAPGTVFGTVSGPLVDLGIQNEHSIQFPLLFKVAIARKRSDYIGLGKNIWPAVEVNDTADLYLILFNAIRSNPDSVPFGREGIYFAESSEYTGYEIAKATSEALVELGVSQPHEPTAFKPEELDEYFGIFWPFLSTNSRARADRSRALGWKPTHGKDALLASIKPEVEYYWNESRK